MGGVAWSEEEDNLLKKCIEQYGEGKWHRIPFLAGLNRCRKSCRLRWLNYLRPNIKRGSFSEEEINLIIKLHKLLGNRWSLIAGRLPGRTANDVKNFWNCHCKKLYSENHNNNEEKQTMEEGEPSTTRSPFLYIEEEPKNGSKTMMEEDGVFGDLEVMGLEFKDVINYGIADVGAKGIGSKWEWDDLSLDMDLFLGGAM